MQNGQILGGGGSVVSSVQRSTITIAAGALTGTATITAVVLANSRLRFLGGTSSVNSKSADHTINDVRISFTNATTITATRSAQNGADTATIAFEVTEYVPGVIKNVQRGTIAGLNSQTDVIAAVVVAKSELDFLGTLCSSNVDSGPYLQLTSTTVVTATASGGTNWVVGYQVVEFY